MNNKYLALDQSLKSTGWAIFYNDKPQIFGTIAIPANKPIEERLSLFWKELNSLHEEHQFDALYFEDIQQQQNVLTFKRLAYLQATILLWCYWKNVPCEMLAPSHWRSVIKEKNKIAFGRKREEQKQKAQEFVKEYFNKEVSEDEADAICLGYAAGIEKNKNEGAF